MKLFSTFFLLWSLAEVHSEQTFPYVSFMGQTLANHSYVDLSLVGSNNSDSFQCITDLQSCCTVAQGVHRGDWYFPNGTRLPLKKTGDIHLVRTAQRFGLRRNIATSPSGIYRCDIPVHDDYDSSVRETVYVGIYGLGGRSSLFLANNCCSICVSHRVYRKYYNVSKRFVNCISQSRHSPVHLVLYLHWWTCYHCHLDQKLHHCNRRKFNRVD